MNARVLAQEKKLYLVGMLELACEKLDITDAEREMARSRYEAVGEWLSDGQNTYLANSSIYTQGSIRLRTTVRPIGRNEFDVDLICFLPGAANLGPHQVRDLVGNRLKENSTYKGMLEPHNRAWRLVYANEFHMDITPAIADPKHANGAVLVPDRELQDWKESHPKGYASWFEGITKREPGLLLEKRAIKADVEPMPSEIQFMGSLRRIVQIMKRHRDVWCSKLPAAQRDDAPISIILTTLAARAYEGCVHTRYDNALDLLLDVVDAMPRFIEQRTVYPAGLEDWIQNPMNAKENFADKWKAHPQRKVAFGQWHRQFRTDLDRLAQQQGLDAIATGLGGMLDESISKSVLAETTRRLNSNREYGRVVTGAGGLIGTALAQPASAVPKNTFYGE